MKHQTRAVKIGNTTIGPDHFAVIAGPCSIESEQHFIDVAQFVKSKGATQLRGGIYKMRTSPSNFQGLKQKAYSIVHTVRQLTGLPVIAEVTDPRQIEEMSEVVDGFQVGSRNMYNYELLKELGLGRTPVVLKRGFSAYVHEWVSASEYILKGGNDQVIFCERGIRTFETATRNTLDLNAVALLKTMSELPVIVDPSHGTGIAHLVAPLALAAAAVGADGVMIEVHPEPEKALSDKDQALNYQQFEELMMRLPKILEARK